ncbi:MAG: hypothetical protein IJD22_00255 [Clostridia bacterium]|nr:hypothetical protein [Clostridia bacterium]
MKRIVLVLLALACVVAMCSCGVSEEDLKARIKAELEEELKDEIMDEIERELEKELGRDLFDDDNGEDNEVDKPVTEAVGTNDNRVETADREEDRDETVPLDEVTEGDRYVVTDAPATEEIGYGETAAAND